MRGVLCILLLVVLGVPARAQQSQNVSLLGNWHDTSITVNTKSSRYNNVWGFVQNGKEYAAIGSTEGVHIIDVNTYQQVAFARSTSAGDHVINRDYKTYKNYLYAACDQGDDSRLEVYDMSYLPDSLHKVYTSTRNVIITTHSLFVDSAKAKLYLGIAAYDDPGCNYCRVTTHLQVFSLATPAQPTYITTFNYFNIHDMYVRNDTGYLSASQAGYVIADFSSTNGTGYEILGVLSSYDYKGYNHSSWMNSKGIGVMADETYGMPMKVINTKECNNIEVISNFSPRWGDSTCTPHNPYILNEDYALISYYLDGLQIYNISKPDSPYRTGYYDTYPGQDVQVFAGAWGCYPYLPSRKILISDMQTGLYVLNADTALNLHVQDTTIAPPTGKDFVLYPNPAMDKVNALLPERGNGEARIYDITGKCVMEQAFYADPASDQGIELPLPRNFPAGMYTVRIVMRENSYKGKFIKAQN